MMFMNQNEVKGWLKEKVMNLCEESTQFKEYVQEVVTGLYEAGYEDVYSDLDWLLEVDEELKKEEMEKTIIKQQERIKELENDIRVLLRGIDCKF